MNLTLVIINSAIIILSKLVLFLTLLHLLFTISYDHAIICSLAIIAMTISEIYLTKILRKGLK